MEGRREAVKAQILAENKCQSARLKGAHLSPLDSTFLLTQHVTSYATTPNPKAGVGVQRSSAGRQPVVQAQIPVVQDLLCGNDTQKVPYYRKKAPAYRGKSGQNSETGRIRFRRVRFQTPNSVSFSGLTEFRGANLVSSFQPIICV